MVIKMKIITSDMKGMTLIFEGIFSREKEGEEKGYNDELSIEISNHGY